uniref:hypothetical protein n=1 Tax=Thaumasiovibrio occultus TaxID=1891184 RepID=UPI000B356BCA|nr:hypothetical protein [Thaumasiovibrio occultus]
MDAVRAALMEHANIIFGVPFFMLFVTVWWSSRRDKNAPWDKAKYQHIEANASRIELYASSSFMLFSCLIGVMLWAALKFTSDLLMLRVEDSVFVFPPSAAVWFLPAIFAAMFLSVLPSRWLVSRVCGKNSYNDYYAYLGYKHGMDYTRFMKRLSVLCAVPIVTFTLAAFDSYIRVTHDTFVVNDLFSIGERHYSFQDIRSVYVKEAYTDEDGTSYKPNTKISFKDGYVYNFHVSMTQVDFEQQRKIAHHITTNLLPVGNVF